MHLRNRYYTIRMTIVLVFLTMGMANAKPLEKNVILNSLNREHPRLLITKQDISRLQTLIQDDPTAHQIYLDLHSQADQILGEPTVEYKIVGPRLLEQSRRCLERVYALGLLYLLDQDPRYRQRAIRELGAAAEFPDWNPSHFLDTSEMTHAFAIGYDWLYNDLSQNEKESIRTALVEKGLRAYLAGKDNDAWWIESQHNWNQVCHGGIGIGALAVADEFPEMAQDVLSTAIEKMPLALQHYAPDGGWNEGPGYWHYASRYTVYFLASLQTALGTDFGLSDYPGMENTGQFRIDFQSPIGLTFNYADAGNRVGGTEEMFWLAKRYQRPVYAWMERQELQEPHALDLIWYSAEGSDPQSSHIPLDSYYKGIDVVFLRSAWNDPHALFVGFKGGDNQANHSHLDLGSFVLDALGERWGVDIGPDDYNLPGYFGDLRWTYFRLINASHNTLTLNGENQDPDAQAPMIEYHSSSNWSYAVADLHAAYHVKKLNRGIAMIDRQSILIQDEFESDQPVNWVWGMMTPAEISSKENQATLSIKGKQLQVKILTPSSAYFDVEIPNPPEPQRQISGLKRLMIRLPKTVDSLRLAVLFTPGSQSDSPPDFNPAVESLERWKSK